MKLTVAIITRNRDKQLLKCLKSLVNQTDRKFTVLVVDNGSNDQTKEVVSSFREKLKIHYYFEGIKGAAQARNKVLSVIKGDLMATLDDDCEAFKNWVEEIKKTHKDFPNAAVVQGWGISKPKGNYFSILSQFIQESGFKQNLVCEKDFTFYFSDKFLKLTCPINLIDGKCASFRLDVVKRLKLTFNTSWPRGDDFEFSKQLLSKKQLIIFNPKILVYHWERSTLTKFLAQRFSSGAEVMRAQLLWPKKYFPVKKPFWWISRGVNFIFYIYKGGYTSKVLVLLPLFLIERSATISGRIVEYFRWTFSRKN